MDYSDKLNGYWEEGYHYYMEFRNEKLIVRDYRRRIELETNVSYDADRLESGERTIITLENNILSRTGDGEMMSEIKELAYENDELKMLYNYIVMGETLYTLTKKDGGPFSHIIIRDEEFIDKLQGVWEEWSINGKGKFPLVITGNSVYCFGSKKKFHVVSYTYDNDNVYIVPEDLTLNDFGGFTRICVYPDMLTTTMMVYDMSMPLSVFARENMLDKIEVPQAAKQVPVNVMMNRNTHNPDMASIGMMGMDQFIQNINKKEEVDGNIKNKPVNNAGDHIKFCPSCGYKLPEERLKFCAECGERLDKY